MERCVAAVYMIFMLVVFIYSSWAHCGSYSAVCRLALLTASWPVWVPGTVVIE